MTDPDDERRALTLFEQLLDVPEDQRDAWVAEQTRGQPAVAARIAAMRTADRMSNLRTGAASDELEEEAPPDRIGAYRMAARIGRGGMGSVYLGERDAGDFAHLVAIKIIKPGLLSESLVERFRRERQTLAQLRHPNIAQLHDGGETAAGSPYIVMELVDGEPLLTWAESRGLSADARARIFVTICEAVAFAHRSLVVHRDLTPSNILVTADGTPKLIDFGIAKPAEEAADGAERESPSLGSLSLTPGFAAPERMNSAAVTTAADIYSLGKVLAALISDRDADLQAIVARAAAEAPGDRYATARELADDVEAWRTGFPVAARGGGGGYVARRFVARHRLAVFASIAALILLTGALVYALVANVRAQEARREAEHRFEQVRELAGFMLFQLTGQMGRVPGNTAARAALADRAQAYLQQLADSPGASAELRLETARGLIRLARILGVPNEPNLGERARATAALDSASRLLEDAGEGQRAAAYLALADVYRALIALHGDSQEGKARTLLAAAESRLAAVPAAERDTEWVEAARSLRTAQLDLADAAQERPTIAGILEAAQRDRQSWPAAMRTGDEARIDDAQAAYYSGLRLSETDKPAALDQHLIAERLYDGLLEQRRDDPVLLYRAAWNAADGFVVASEQEKEDISNRLVSRGVVMMDRLAAIDDRDDSVRALRLNLRESYAQNLRDIDRFDEAIALQRQVVADRLAGVARDGSGRLLGSAGFSHAILGNIARDAGNRDLACESYRHGAELMDRAEALHQLIGFHASLMPGLRDKVRACAAGASIAGPLRP